ncbi:hypothetical protein BpHYR1_052034 [Brachionus plicatilis]|uniref:Uncharacterized protein n=1 Tax=Brachionus plicatilis TaxID=10195 RepID=A0A3M7Q0B6_BRAPC|nr:hypothetical protein BpHYR1_052034 [Brachionus plicatilis]
MIDVEIDFQQFLEPINTVLLLQTEENEGSGEEDEYENPVSTNNNKQLVNSKVKDKWSKYKTHEIQTGKKVYYKCVFSNCPAEIYLFYLKNQLKISIFINNKEHHDYEKKKENMDPK